MTFQPHPLGGPLGTQLLNHLGTGGHNPLAQPCFTHPLAGPMGTQIANSLNLFKPVATPLPPKFGRRY